MQLCAITVCLFTLFNFFPSGKVSLNVRLKKANSDVVSSLDFLQRNNTRLEKHYNTGDVEDIVKLRTVNYTKNGSNRQKDIKNSTPTFAKTTAARAYMATTNTAWPFNNSSLAGHLEICDGNQEPNWEVMRTSGYRIPPKVTEAKFTVLILTHRRKHTLYKCLRNYANMTIVGQIVVLWNDNVLKPPDIEKDINFTVPFSLEARENKLSTRFFPAEEILYQGL